MNCPVCKTTHIEPKDLEANLSAYSCQKCEGIWLSSRKYFDWLEKHGPKLPEKPYSEIAFETDYSKGAKICPECSRILVKYKVGHGINFCIDNCGVCNGVWLDRNEWEILKDRNLHDEIHRVFTTSWQRGVREENTREQLEKLYSRNFGAADYAKLREFKAWLNSHAQKKRMIAYLNEADPYKL